MADFTALKAVVQENNPGVITTIGTPGYPATGDTDWSSVNASNAGANELAKLASNQIWIGEDGSSIADPTTAPTLTSFSTGGTLLNGTYQVSYSYTDAHGHTAGSTNGVIPLISAGSTYKIHVDAITLPTGVTGVDWFVSSIAGGSTQKLYVHSTTGAAFDITTLPTGTDSKWTTNTTATPDHAVKKGLVGRTGIDITTDGENVYFDATGDTSIPQASTTVQGILKTSYASSDPKALVLDDPLVGLIGTVNGVVDATGAAPTAGNIFKANSGTTAKWELIAPSGSSLPSTGTALEGDLFFLTTDSNLYYFYSGGWVDVTGSGGGGGSSTLTDGHIFVGDSSNLEADVAMSGDASIDNTGAVTVLAVQGKTFAATAPSAGDVWTWNSGTSQYEPTAPAGGSGGADATSIQGVNVSSTAPADGEALVYDSGTSQYVPGTVSGGGGATFSGASVTRTTNFSLPNGSALTVPFTSETFDTDSYHDNSTNNSRITIPTGKGGYFNVSCCIWFSSNSSGLRALDIVQNGTINLIESQVGANPAGETGISMAANVYLADGDYIEIYVYQDSGSTLNVLARSVSAPCMTIARLG